MSTQDVLDHHLQAFGAGDADEIVKDFTVDSVLITPDAVIRGRDAIRAAFAGFFEGIFKPGTYEFGLDKAVVEGDVAYVTWHAEVAPGRVPLGTDTFVVRDGKIAVQTFAMHLQPNP